MKRSPEIGGVESENDVYGVVDMNVSSVLILDPNYTLAKNPVCDWSDRSVVIENSHCIALQY